LVHFDNKGMAGSRSRHPIAPEDEDPSGIASVDSGNGQIDSQLQRTCDRTWCEELSSHSGEVLLELLG
jgi:hypothetical protein